MGLAHRVHTEWHWTLSGVHSIMMVKPAQSGVGRGCTPSPFNSIYTVTRPYAGFRHPDLMEPDQTVRGGENDYPILYGNLLP
jgi:hypothetical protein